MFVLPSVLLLSVLVVVCLDPDATILSGQNSSIFVRDALLHKHPSLVKPGKHRPQAGACLVF